jgi:hypothetical protein
MAVKKWMLAFAITPAELASQVKVQYVGGQHLRVINLAEWA